MAEDEAGENAEETGEPNDGDAPNSSPTRMSLSALGKRKAAEIDIADKVRGTETNGRFLVVLTEN